MKRYIQVVLLIFSFSMIQAQNVSPWKRIISSQNLQSTRLDLNGDPKNGLYYELDQSKLKSSLDTIHTSNRLTKVIIEIPNTNGELEKYEIHEFSNFEPDLQAQFPEIRAYIGRSLSDKEAILYCSFSPKGIQTMVVRLGKPSEFIEKVSRGSEIYELFDSNTKKSDELPLYCATLEKGLNSSINKATIAATSFAGQYKTLRLAIACTAEYTHIVMSHRLNSPS
mgnify:FL=1